jgi:GT2 family glycosyltransferase
MTTKPIISAIVPTYHRNDLLAKCLDCLAPGVQTLDPDRYEVIVTDDGSQSTAEELIRDRYPWVKWVPGCRQGPAANRNNGAKYAKGDWLVFTDDDCLPDDNFLSAFFAAFQEGVFALEGAIYPIGNPDRDLADCPVNVSGGNFWSANIAIKKSIFEQIGGFDSNYPFAAFEDMDLKLRLAPLTAIPFISDARVYHPVRNRTLMQAILSIPKRCHAWAYHVNKNRNLLGYDRLKVIIFRPCKIHGHQLICDFKSRHFGHAIYSLLMLAMGIPLFWFNFYRFDRAKKST